MVTIGVDLGGTNIVAGVVDEQYTILAKTRCKTRAERSSEEIMRDIAWLCREAVKKAGLSMSDVGGVGIGCPGTCNTETGMVEYANNLNFNNVPLVARMNELLGVPVYINNDANVAALGEAVAGAAKGAQSCICITLGTGVGGGVILDGKIYEGCNYAGAEMGHIVIQMNGDPCTCGRQGCLESYASATALVRQTKRAMEQHPESTMWKQVNGDITKVNGLTAFDGMRAGDAVATAVVDQFVEYLACGVTNIINIFQPDIVCIGGGISHEGETLVAPLRERVVNERYSKFCEKQTQVVAAVLGNDAGVIGAACLAK